MNANSKITADEETNDPLIPFHSDFKPTTKEKNMLVVSEGRQFHPGGVNLGLKGS